MQNVIVYLIVAAAAAWQIWYLFVPAAVKKRLHPGKPGGHDCSDGCAGCPSACTRASPSPARIKARNLD